LLLAHVNQCSADTVEPQILGGKPSTVASEDDVGFVDDDRNCEAELADASRDLADLVLGVDMRIRRMRAQLDLAGGHMGLLLSSEGAVHIAPYHAAISNILTTIKKSHT
jgi:hypothetical protein